MPDKEYTIQDMIGAASQESPSEFQNAFNNAIVDRIAKIVDDKKQEIAQTYFNNGVEAEQEEPQQTSAEDESQEQEDQNEEETDENTETAAGV